MNNHVKALMALDARVKELAISHEAVVAPPSAFSDDESAEILLAETYLRAERAVTDLIIAAAKGEIFADLEIGEDDIDMEWYEDDTLGHEEVARAVAKGRARVMIALAHFTIDKAFVALANETAPAPRR